MKQYTTNLTENNEFYEYLKQVFDHEFKFIEQTELVVNHKQVNIEFANCYRSGSCLFVNYHVFVNGSCYKSATVCVAE